MKTTFDNFNIDRFKKTNPHLHSELHELIDEIRKEFGETHIKKGEGSFGFYLGLLRNIPTSMIWQWRSEIRQSDATGDLGKLFVWKVKKWKTTPNDST